MLAPARGRNEYGDRNHGGTIKAVRPDATQLSGFLSGFSVTKCDLWGREV
jgi:hypothetical protein